MKILILLYLVVYSGMAFSSLDATQTLMDAMTVCPADQNPSSMLKKLGGNSFINTSFEPGTNAVITSVIDNPQLINPLFSRPPSRLLGSIKVEMTYPSPRYRLVCVVSKIP